MDFRSRLPMSARPSGIRPPGTFNRKSTLGGDEQPGRSNFGRPFQAPNSATSRTSLYSNARLSVLASAHKNAFSARKSKVGLFGTTPQSKRPSYQPSTASSARRSSIIGQSRHIQENRPLSDRSYHSQCFEKVFTFLQSQGFNHMLTPKFVMSPSTSDVRKIFEFLFYVLDDKFKIVNFEVDVIQIMKQIRYPFQINKSYLQSMSSLQARGHLFGMLEWLVDAITYQQAINVERLVYPSFDDGFNINAEIFKMACDPELDPDEMMDGLIQRKFGTKEEFDSLEKEREQLAEEVKQLTDQIEKLKGIPEAIEAYRRDTTRMDEFITKMSEHIEQHKKAFEQLQSELNERTEMLRTVEGKKSELLQQVKAQNFGIEEVEYARQRQQQYDEEILLEEKSINDQKANNRLIKLEFNKLVDTVKKMHSDARSWLEALNDLISSHTIANYAAPMKSLLKDQVVNELINYFASDFDSSERGRRARATFSELSNTLKVRVLEQLTALEGIAKTNQQQRLSDVEMQLADLAKINETIQNTAEELKLQLENIRKQQSLEQSTLQKEYELNKQRMADLDMKVKFSQEEIKERIDNLQRTLKEEQKATLEIKQKLLGEFKTFAETQRSGALKALNLMQNEVPRLKAIRKELNKELQRELKYTENVKNA